jgi:hypothetical protein
MVLQTSWFLVQSSMGPGLSPTNLYHYFSRFMQKGYFGVTNITTSTSTPPVNVKTVIKGNGDPGYLLTASKHFQFEVSSG